MYLLLMTNLLVEDMLLSIYRSVTCYKANVLYANYLQEGGVVFNDLKSRFGSEINSNKVTSETTLHNNDIIKIGQGPSTFK